MSQKINLTPPLAAELDGSMPVNPLDQLLGYQLRRASVAMLADLAESLAGVGLRVTEVSVLLVIETNPDITQSEIGRVLGIQRANMVPLTTQLERRELIHRASSSGRAQALRLTPAGAALARECRERIAAHEARFLTGLDEAQRTALIAQLRQIWDR
ncbi:MAG TPA: MarR family transcriptional regulator [Acidocella sp.]|nr:MarR family transcriptional regulator [Acidocella sp.]